MKMAVAIAVFAVGCGCGGIAASAEMVEIVKQIGVLAFGVFAVVYLLKMFKMVKHLKEECSFIAEKCSYMEKRMDAGNARIGDLCRHMVQVFEEFDEDLNEAKDEASKWWWVQRRMRNLYEDFCCSANMHGVAFQSVKHLWSLLQLEVKLRTRRDLVACRYFAVPGADLTAEHAVLEHCMKNIEKASQHCEFWRPMPMYVFEAYEASSGFEEILVSQLKERIAELKDYADMASGKHLFEGFHVEGLFGDSSGN